MQNLDGPNLLIDTARANAKYAARAQNPLRTHEGTFILPSDMKGKMLEQHIVQQTGAFVTAMAKKGWKLESKVAIYGPRLARDLNSGAALLGMNEWVAQAVFSTVPKPMPRIELPSAAVKQAPDHVVRPRNVRDLVGV